MLDLVKHIVNQKSASFAPKKFEDHYETALIDLINQKRSGKPITPKERPRAGNVVDLMEALRRSVGQEAAPARGGKPAKKPGKVAADQKEMLMPIEGKRPGKEAAAKKPAGRRSGNPLRNRAVGRPVASCHDRRAAWIWKKLRQ